MNRKTLLTAAVATAALALPATASADYFGAKLNKNTQPSNSLPAHKCNETGKAQKCTRVSVDALYNLGGAKAHKDGTIRKIKLIAGGPGSFKLQLAKAKPNQEKAKVVRSGPQIRYEGQGPVWNEPYKIETFPVNLKVYKGEYLAIKAKKTSMLRCNSGSTRQLLFQPPLAVGGPFMSADDTDGCHLLLKAVYK